MNKKVTHARFHTELHLPSVGVIGTTVPPVNKTLDNLQMTAHDNVLDLQFVFRGRAVALLIPFGNIVLMETASELKTQQTAVSPSVKIAA